MGRGGSTTFKRMRGSKVCPRGLAQQWGRLLVPLFVLFRLVCIAGSVLQVKEMQMLMTFQVRMDLQLKC